MVPRRGERAEDPSEFPRWGNSRALERIPRAFFDIAALLVYFLNVMVILTGPVRSGKTSLLRTLAAEWRAQGLAFDGYLSPRVEAKGRPIGYDLLDLKTGKKRPFLRIKGEPNWERAGPYSFLPDGLAAAKRKIATWNGRGVLVVDEVGPLELRGGGVWPELGAAASAPGCLLLVVRSAILERLAELWPGRKMSVVAIESPEAGVLLSREIGAGESVPAAAGVGRIRRTT